MLPLQYKLKIEASCGEHSGECSAFQLLVKCCQQHKHLLNQDMVIKAIIIIVITLESLFGSLSLF